MKRIFIGLPIAKTLAEEISKWQEGQQKLPVRWLAPKNLHLTLIPPWYETDVERVAAQLVAVGELVQPFLV